MSRRSTHGERAVIDALLLVAFLILLAWWFA